MGTRKEFADALKPLLPRNFEIIDRPAGLPEISSRTKAVVMLIRQTIVKAPNALGNYVETFTVWVIEPKTDDEGRSEDSLDHSLDQTIVAIDTLPPAFKWTRATRDKFPEPERPAYRLDVDVITQHKE